MRLRGIGAALNAVKYCIVSGWQSLPEGLPSDLDIVVRPQDLRTLETALSNYDDAQIIQLLQHETTCYYIVLAIEEDRIHLVPLDVATDYRRDGYIFFSAETLLYDRHPWNEFWVAAPNVEFAYLLVKKILKGDVPDNQKRRLHEIACEMLDEPQSITRHLFGERLGDITLSWIRTEDWPALAKGIPMLRRALLWNTVRRDPTNQFRYWIPEVWRAWRRWRHPTGLLVVVLGPDGAGKSTLVGHLQERLSKAFRDTATFHFRPHLVDGSQAQVAPVSDPHAKSPYPWSLSLLKLLYYLMDYILGYFFGIRPRLVRSTFVLFDRYYEDLLVDPCRYRYGGSHRILTLCQQLVPSPDLFLVLDIPAETAVQRKQEVSCGEAERQRRAYRRLARNLPNAVLLDGTLSEDQLVWQASKVVLDYLHRRYLKRRSLWFRSNAESQIY